MKILNSIDSLRAFQQEQEGTLGFVPTMGALHAGHVSLVARSTEECGSTVVSIYVNPTQFNNANDLANYPDTLAEDLKPCPNQWCRTRDPELPRQPWKSQLLVLSRFATIIIQNYENSKLLT